MRKLARKDKGTRSGLQKWDQQLILPDPSVLVASHHEAARLVLGADLGLELKIDLSQSFYGGQGKSWSKAT